jgi:streptogramin lyase
MGSLSESRLAALRSKYGEPRVELWGPSLGTGRKFLGGAFTIDGTALLGVPSHADAVLRLDLQTGAVSKLPGPRITGKFKWLRGVRAADGSVYCIPACGDGVLRISADQKQVHTLGRGDPMFEGTWLWHGGQLGSDGNIYAIPANAERVLKIDPVTQTVTTIGPALQVGVKNKWYGGIMGEDGSIWGMPYNASALLKIVPATGEVREVGSFPLGKPLDARTRDPVSAASLVSPLHCLTCSARLVPCSRVLGGWKWHGGTRSGPYIVGIPSHAESVLLIDPRTEEYRLLGSGYVGKYKWGGAQTDAEGMVWAIPSDVDYALRIDPFRGEVERVGPHPLVEAWRNRWQGGVHCKADGRIYCIPCDAERVLVIDPKTRTLSLLGALPTSQHKFQGAATAADGTIWALPEAADQVLRITPNVSPPKGVSALSGAAGMQVAEVPTVTNVCHGQSDTMPARLKGAPPPPMHGAAPPLPHSYPSGAAAIDVGAPEPRLSEKARRRGK